MRKEPLKCYQQVDFEIICVFNATKVTFDSS